MSFIIEKKFKDTDGCKALVKFSKDRSINAAYNRMTSNIAVILETKNVKFNNLRRACIQEINTLGSTLPKDLVHKIQPTKTLDELLDVLALSPYWNWFDTRLLQALVSASGSPEAEEWLESFKATFYAKKVTELIPYISIKPFKESIDITEKFDKDPKDITISELLEHKYKLEYEVLDIDEGELVLSCIKTGCVELTWQLPQELVYRAYTSMKRKHDELSSFAVKSLVCEEADENAGLPILWHGQEVGEVGPIEPLPEHVRQKPYSLPQGFQWVPLSSGDIDAEKLMKFIKRNNDSMKNVDNERFIQTIDYYSTHPSTRHEWQFSIQTTGGKLIGVVMAAPRRIHIGNEIKVLILPAISYHRKYKNKRLWYILCKELMRRANLTNINQFIFPSTGRGLFKPVATTMTWSYQFNQPTSSQLPSSPRTPGWRRITSEDVPSALALVNKWSSQFEIGQVFNSEEEFAHNFLLQKYLVTYVVEKKANSVTDLICCTSSTSTSDIGIFTVVSTQSPVKQLIIDALVCARKNGAGRVLISQHNIETDILTSLSFQPLRFDAFHFYNYKYHEILWAKFWIFAS